ncbi:uncharacterized protein LOC108151691 [Drosophila miranda]|uniref:uncharacterized protein LOC108151691 n=1 Tax=Drosophila miranda TaxID=7229 RepID=UPI00143F7CCF|nr:uncharacterized protein LOC108151691 [Drosophila miranda]
MERNHKKGGRILVERQQRLSMQKRNCFYIRDTQIQVREVLFRTADNLGVDRGSLIKVPSRETQARERQHVDQLNRRIKYEIDQLKFLRRNIIQKPVEYKASESYMHDKEFTAEESSDESQSCDTGDQRIIQTLSCRTELHTNKRYKRAEGGCNYIPRQRNKCRDLEPRSVYQCDYGNSSRCIACFAGAQQQFQDDNNYACCTLRPSVPIPVMPSPCCQYQPSWACVLAHPFNPRTTTDLNTEDFCRSWCACVVPDRAQKLKHRSHRASEDPSRSKSRSSSKGSRAVDEKIRSKLKKSRAAIDSSSLDQYNVQSHEKLLKVTMRKESKSKSSTRRRGSKSPAVEGKLKTEGKEIDEQADNTTKGQKFFEYMDKFENENGNAESEQGKAGEGSQLESNPTYTRIPHIKREPGESKYDEIVFTPDKNKESACLDSCPEVTCKPPQSAYEERGVCDKEKCDCVGQKDKTEAEYKYQHPAQDDGREPKSGEEGVCLDSCPGGTFKPPKSAYDEGVPISTADKIAERGEAVSHKEKCACVTQEVQTDDEFVKKETRLTQTDLKLQEEQLTQTDPQGSQHEGPAQTEMGCSRLDMLTKNDLQGSQQESVPIFTPDETGERGRAVCQKNKCVCVSQEAQTDGEYTYERPAQDDGRDPRAGQKGVCADSCPGVTGKPSQSAYDDQVSISTSDKRAERGKTVCSNKKCACLLKEVLADGKFTGQRPAQEDRSESRSGQKGGVPGVTGKPPQSAYDDQVSIFTPDKTVERDRAVCQKKKCACVAQEFQTDGEYTNQRPAQDDGRDPRAEQKGVFLDSCPRVTGKSPQSSYDDQVSISTSDKRVERSKAVCRNKKCTSAAQEFQPDGEYTYQRPAQDDGRDPRAGQKRVCVDSCPLVTGKPSQSAYDDQVSISTSDKRVERSKAVCRNKKCTSAAQEFQPDGEYTYQRPAQDDGRDPRAGQKRVCVDSCPLVTGKPSQSAYDDQVSISTSDKRVERSKAVCRNKKCTSAAQEFQPDGEYTYQRPAQHDGRDPRAGQKRVCVDSCPLVTGKPSQSAYDDQVSISTSDKRVERSKAVCRNKKCTSAAQEFQPDGEYTYQRPAQHDGRDPRAGQKRVCVDSCPLVTGKPSQSAYDDQVSISTSDKRVERSKAVCRNKKCTSAAQTDGEYTYQRPAQDDGRDPRAGQKRVCVESCPEGTCKPLQSAYDERDQISTSNKRVEKDRVRRNPKCGCRAQEVQNDEELSKKVTMLTQTDLKALEEQVTQTDLQGSRQETVPQTDVQGSQHDGITQADLQGRQHERFDQNDLQENQYKGLVQTEPEINHEIGSGKSAISGAAISKAEQFSTWSPNDDKDVQTASQKEKKQNQRQDSPSASSRKIYSAQSPSSQKYMKYISRGSLTEQSEQDGDAEHRSNSRRYPAKQCQCKPVSSGPSQQTQVLEEPKEQQYLVDDKDIPVGTACPLKKSSPFCDPLPPAAKCDLHPVGCYCDTNEPKIEKPKTSGRAKHTERSRNSSPTNTKSQKKGPDNTKQYQQYESTYQYSYGRSEDAENVDSSGTGTTSNNMDNKPSKVLNKKHVQAHGCDTDCSGRSLSGCNISIDSYLGPQATSSRLINYQYSNVSTYNPPNQSLVPRLPALCQLAGAFNCATADNDACKQVVPIYVCEKRTRSVTFEDECGKVRAMRNIADNIRSRIDWERIVKTRMSPSDRDTDSTSQSNAAFGRMYSTDDNNGGYSCRSSNSAATDITCTGSEYHTVYGEDISNYEDDFVSSQVGNCPCLLRTYVSLASICTNDSRSILQEEEEQKE